MTTFDFEDGKGPVPAHKHRNGGSWVANTSIVADTAYVGPNARVFGSSHVAGSAIISDKARISDSAWVYGDTMVSGNAKVSGNARVYDENVTDRALGGDYNSPTKNNEQPAKNVDANIEIKLYTDFIIVNGVKYIKEPT